MTTLGLIGGIGPESTVEYYRQIIAAYRQQRPDGSYPQLLVNSIDMKRMLDLIGANEIAALTTYLLREIQKLARGGADFGALASNTPHVIFDILQERSPIPLVSIVDAACERAQALGLKRVGLFGTRFTMQGQFYPAVFSRARIEVVTPSPDEQTYIHDKYMGELVNGVILPETRQRLMQIVEALAERENIQGLILGGTELPLILGQVQASIPFLDTTRIHVEKLVGQLVA